MTQVISDIMADGGFGIAEQLTPARNGLSRSASSGGSHAQAEAEAEDDDEDEDDFDF